MADNIVILGAGAIGGLAGGVLSREGADVTLVDPWFQHVETIRRNGLQVSLHGSEFTVHPRALPIDLLAATAPIDILVVALKSYDTEWAVRYAAPYLARDGFVASLQNGVNEQTIASIVGQERTVGGVTHLSAICPGAGVVHGTSGPGWKAYTFGELDGRESARVDRLTEMLSPVGPTASSNAIWTVIWSKLTFNVMGNALAGLTGLNTHDLWTNPQALQIMAHLGGETILTAQGKGHSVGNLTPAGATEPFAPELIVDAHLGDAKAFEEFSSVFRSVAAGRVGAWENKSSLLQDVLKHRRSEVDYLNGYVVRAGASVGVNAETNAAMVEVLHDVDLGLIGPDARNLDRVLARPAEDRDPR